MGCHSAVQNSHIDSLSGIWYDLPAVTAKHSANSVHLHPHTISYIDGNKNFLVTLDVLLYDVNPSKYTKRFLFKQKPFTKNLFISNRRQRAQSHRSKRWKETCNHTNQYGKNNRKRSQPYWNTTYCTGDSHRIAHTT